MFKTRKMIGYAKHLSKNHRPKDKNFDISPFSLGSKANKNDCSKNSHCHRAQQTLGYLNFFYWDILCYSFHLFPHSYIHQIPFVKHMMEISKFRSIELHTANILMNKYNIRIKAHLQIFGKILMFKQLYRQLLHVDGEKGHFFTVNPHHSKLCIDINIH